MGWKRVPLSGGVYVFEGAFSEPSDEDLKPYGIGTGKHARQAVCGTMAGCAAHRRAGEIPCDPCRKAERAYGAERRAKLAHLAAAQSVPETGDAA